SHPRSTLVPYTTLFRSSPPSFPGIPAGCKLLVNHSKRTNLSTTGTATPTKWKRTTQVSEGIMTEQSAYHSTLIIEITEFRFRFRSEEHTSELQSRENLV